VTTTLYPEVEGPIKAWCKTVPSIADLTAAGRYVYFSAPDVAERPAQWLTIRRIGGAPLLGNTPLDQPLVTFQCYGRTRLLASQLAEAVANAIQAVEQTPMGDTLVALQAQVTLWLFQPDPTLDDFPRVVVDALLVVRSSTA